MEVFTQLYLLQYKNWKLQFRRKLVTVLELIIPVALCALLVVIRHLVDVTEYKSPTNFPSYRIDDLPKVLVEKFRPIKAFSPTIGLAYTPNNSYTTEIMKRVHDKIIPSYSNSFCKLIHSPYRLWFYGNAAIVF